MAKENNATELFRPMSEKTIFSPTSSPLQSPNRNEQFEVPWLRQESPRSLVSSFQLVEGLPWGDPTFIIPVDTDEASTTRRNYVEILLLVLSWGGWILKPGSRRRLVSNCMPFVVSISMNIFVVVSTLCSAWNHESLESYIVSPFMHGTVSPEDWTITYVDAVMRHVFIFAAHIGMYFHCLGQRELAIALGKREFAPQAGYALALFGLAALELLLDLIDLHYLLFRCEECEGWSQSLARRLCILLSRFPATASLVVMTSMPTCLCQDLLRIEASLEHGNVADAHRLYSIFWKRLSVVRSWYNAVVTPHFLIAIGRIPIAFYCFVTLRRDEYGWNVVRYIFTFAVVDVVMMFVWLSPAIAIRPKHRNVLDAALTQAGLKPSENTDRARDLATMIGQLHPLVGMKFLDHVVTWKLVTQISTVASISLSLMKALLRREVSSPIP